MCVFRFKITSAERTRTARVSNLFLRNSDSSKVSNNILVWPVPCDRLTEHKSDVHCFFFTNCKETVLFDEDDVASGVGCAVGGGGEVLEGGGEQQQQAEDGGGLSQPTLRYLDVHNPPFPL